MNGIPSDGQIALAAGDYIDGLTKMWGEAFTSSEWWAYAITTAGHFTIKNIIPRIDKSVDVPISIDNNSLGKMIGMLKSINKNKGNYGIGTATKFESEIMAKAWLGKNFRESSINSGIFISSDGLRQYRSPKFKPKLRKVQANFEWRNEAKGAW